MQQSKPGAAPELPEVVFLKYAYPCTLILRQRGLVDDETLETLEKHAFEQTPAPRALLESTYKKAFERIRKLAAERDVSDYWDAGLIRDYFRNRHNDVIEAGDGYYAQAPEEIKDLCKVVEGTVVERKDGFLVVNCAGRPRVAGAHFLPDAKAGDRVMLHHGFAVELA